MFLGNIQFRVSIEKILTYKFHKNRLSKIQELLKFYNYMDKIPKQQKALVRKLTELSVEFEKNEHKHLIPHNTSAFTLFSVCP